MLAVLGAGAMGGLAGCSGDGGDGDTDGGDGGDTDGGEGSDGAVSTPTADDVAGGTTERTATPTSTGGDRDLGDPAGSLGAGGVEGLTITSLDSHIGSSGTFDGAWVTDITVENTGDQETELREYSYELVLYDGSDTVLSEGRARLRVVGDTVISPGDSKTFPIAVSPDPMSVDPDQVARYEVSISCRFADGVYCE